MFFQYTTYADFLSRYLPGKIQKIAVNAGFSCPNRDGTIGWGGCAFCTNESFVPSYCNAGDTIAEQLRKGVLFFRRKYPAMQFLAYFQAYTNTYASVDNLRRRYYEALEADGVVGLVIATRPDCLPDDVMSLLEELARQTFLCVEIGIETVHNRTLRLIHRGHDYATSATAVKELAARNIHVGAHMILGLPGELRHDILQQAKTIAQLPIQTIKLHQLQILRGTPMERLYHAHPELFLSFTPQSYASIVLDYLSFLPPSVALDRFVNQSPPQLLATPGWGLKNYEFLAVLHNEYDKRAALKNLPQTNYNHRQ